MTQQKINHNADFNKKNEYALKQGNNKKKSALNTCK
jgi:hypothetical protein